MIFTSFTLDEVKHPVNILKEFLETFNRRDKCKAAILSWFDGKHFYGHEWVRATYEEIAKELGYCRETIAKHMKSLIKSNLLLWSDEVKSFAKDTAHKYRINVPEVSRSLGLERCEKPDIYPTDNSHISANNVAAYINSSKSTLNQQQPAAENKNSLEEKQEILTDTVFELKDVCSSDQPVTSQIELPNQELPEVDWDAIKMSVEAEQSAYTDEYAYKELEAITTQVDPIFQLAPQIRLFTIACLALNLKQIIESVEADTHEDKLPAPAQVKKKTSYQTSSDSEELPDSETLRAAYTELRELKCDFRLNAEIQRAIAHNFKNFPQALALLKKRIFENNPPSKTWEALFMWKLKKGATDDDEVIVPANFGKWYDWAYRNGFVERSQPVPGGIEIWLREHVAIERGVSQSMLFDAAVELLGGSE